MTIWWCRRCGLEDTRMIEKCGACGSAMTVADLEWLKEDSEGEETVFELEMDNTERAAIVSDLLNEGIRHRWENGNELVVADKNIDAVESILDEVLGEDSAVDPDASDDDDDADDEEEEAAADEGDYQVISVLYDTVNRLQKKRDDDDVVASFLQAVGATLATPPPFGIDDETWADIQASARNVAANLESDEDTPIDSELQSLRNQLQVLV